ncbi:hypothetical protein AVEN_170284-1 [Araneus ventricosus]|uniref:Uncharacterized protein n=1 Tax=Araneus ventricosus TaxID=182803 RepID=A0A4Y2U4P7_ARAVE|nr:hypothetical protein AVEN_170284-1 [Araneus ventricosus]
MREQTKWQKTRCNMGNPIHLLSFLNRTQKASSGRACLRSGKPHGRMAIQAGKSVTSYPQLVSVPLTGLERMLSSLNKALSLPTSEGFTSLTAIIAVVVELARHFTMSHSVLVYEEASAKLRTRMAEKSLQ